MPASLPLPAPQSAAALDEAGASADFALALPLALDQAGANRADPALSQLAARTDAEAVRAWLDARCGSEETRRSYRKEAWRLMLWAGHERGLSLSALAAEDFDAYFAFLRNPAPAARWADPSAGSRGVPLFKGPLSDASVRQAKTILHGLFAWLVAAGHLRGNPIALLRRRAPGSRAKETARFLPREAWSAVLRHIDEAMASDAPQGAAKRERARMLFALFYLTGARISEAAKARMGDFHRRADGWWLLLHGKGGVEASVPATDELMEILRSHRLSRGLPPLPLPGEQEPVIAPLGHLRPGPATGLATLTPNMLHRIAKAVLQAAAEQTDDEHAAGVLRAASAHWLRHTAFTHQAEAGVDLLVIKANARHADLSTTQIYLHTDRERQRSQTQDRHRLRPED